MGDPWARISDKWKKRQEKQKKKGKTVTITQTIKFEKEVKKGERIYTSLKKSNIFLAFLILTNFFKY